MLTTLLLLLAAFLACACALGFDPAFLRAGLWVFLGFAALNILFVIFWVAVAQTVDDSKPIERQKPIYRLGVAIIAGWLCWWARVRVKLSGADKLPGEGRFVLICNHRSGFDPVVTAAKLRAFNLCFISKPSNLKLPYIGKLAYGAGFLPIDRENDRAALKTILTAADYLKKDFCSMVIYPEGTRSKTGALLPFHAGSFKIAQKAGVPLAIACVSGTDRIRHRWLFHSTKVELRILELLPADRVKTMSTQDLAAYSKEKIEEALGLAHGEAEA